LYNPNYMTDNTGEHNQAPSVSDTTQAILDSFSGMARTFGLDLVPVQEIGEAPPEISDASSGPIPGPESFSA
jgi:hypothetical protein